MRTRETEISVCRVIKDATEVGSSHIMQGFVSQDNEGLGFILNEMKYLCINLNWRKT